MKNFAMQTPLRSAIDRHFHMTKTNAKQMPQPLGTYICNNDTLKCHITSLKTFSPDVLKLSNEIVKSRPLFLKSAQGFAIHDDQKSMNVYFKNDKPNDFKTQYFGHINLTDTQDSYDKLSKKHLKKSLNGMFYGSAAVFILSFLKKVK
jgi:hypothetical protein